MNSTKRKCIIVDLDGTLADCNHRVHHVQKDPKDWKSFNELMGEDGLNEWCSTLITSMSNSGVSIILLTGRGEDFREETQKWLLSHNISYEKLIMRKAQDERDDYIIKREAFLDFIKPHYETLFVVEDRLSVVEMWRKEEVTCLQCDWGNF